VQSLRRNLALSIIVIASLYLSSTSVAAQTNLSDWTHLNSLTNGSKLSVKLKSGKTAEGKLSGVTDSALSLTVKNKLLELKREDVLTIHQVTKKSATKSTLIGLAVGTGAGALIGVAADASNNDGSFEKIDNVAAAGVTVIGAVAGTVTGFLIGKRHSKRVLIYEAK
jgi:16S rRNA U1498 N3-methylase RsmE